MNLIFNKSIVVIFVYILFLSACENPFNPSTIPTPEDQYDFSTPQQTLSNLESAYKNMNIDLYKRCLSDDFQFQLLANETEEIGVDFDNDGVYDDSWGYAEEVTFHENLFINGSSDGTMRPPTDIVLIIGIPPEESWPIDENPEHTGWRVLPCTFNLKLQIDSSYVISSWGNATFYMKPVDNEWKVAIWRDRSQISRKGKE